MDGRGQGRHGVAAAAAAADDGRGRGEKGQQQEEDEEEDEDWGLYIRGEEDYQRTKDHWTQEHKGWLEDQVSPKGLSLLLASRAPCGRGLSGIGPPLAVRVASFVQHPPPPNQSAVAVLSLFYLPSAGDAGGRPLRAYLPGAIGWWTSRLGVWHDDALGPPPCPPPTPQQQQPTL